MSSTLLQQQQTYSRANVGGFTGPHEKPATVVDGGPILSPWQQRMWMELVGTPLSDLPKGLLSFAARGMQEHGEERVYNTDSDQWRSTVAWWLSQGMPSCWVQDGADQRFKLERAIERAENNPGGEAYPGPHATRLARFTLMQPGDTQFNVAVAIETFAQGRVREALEQAQATSAKLSMADPVEQVQRARMHSANASTLLGQVAPDKLSETLILARDSVNEAIAALRTRTDGIH